MRWRSLGAIALAVACIGCGDPGEWGPAQLGDGHTSASVRKLELGQEAYGTYCVGCHGEKGDGKGPAERFLNPKPRDFRKGRVKFASVESGQVPTDEDYVRIINEGLSGTAMPAFPLLPAREKEALVAYLKTFRNEKDVPGQPVAVPKDPWSGGSAAAIEEGQKTYHQLVKCWMCHPTYATGKELSTWAGKPEGPPPPLRPNPYDSLAKESEWGSDIRAPDFLVDRIKTGTDVASLVRVIGAGIGGTAMPAWASSLTPEQLWGLAYYVKSLAINRATPEAHAMRAKLIAQYVPPPPEEDDEE